MRRLLHLLVLAAGCSKSPAPLPTFDFAAYGDCRHNQEVHREIVSNIVRTHPKFVLVTGDLVDQPDRESDWQAFRDIAKDLRAQSKYLCCVGDHDWLNVDTFLKEFDLERWYFDKRIGDIHVFVLDSRAFYSGTQKDQVDWLEKTAAASTATHKFAVFHHPPFMIDSKPEHIAQADFIRPLIHPLLVKLKFCAAFCGHQHSFYTTRRDGVRYVVTAGGGAPLWKNLDPRLGLKEDLSRSFFHFLAFSFADRKIEARVFGIDGTEANDLRFTLCEHP
jgi:hypothetical protein